MPQLIPVVVGALAAALPAAITFAPFAFSLTTFLVTFAVNLALGFLMTVLSPKPDTPDFGDFANQSQDQKQMIRQPITNWRVVLGEVRCSGPLVVAETTNDGEFLHLCIALAGHQVDSIPIVFLDDQPIYEDMITGADFFVQEGKYKDKCRIVKHIGEPAQAADPFLVDEVDGYSSTDRMQGRAYVYVRLQYDQEVFPGQIPNISAWVRGLRVPDPRIGNAVRWTPNTALLVDYYLKQQQWGLGATAAEVNSDFAIAGANVCDEIVDVKDSEHVHTVHSVSVASNHIDLNGDMLGFQTGDRIKFEGSSLPAPLNSSASYYAIVYRMVPATARDKEDETETPLRYIAIKVATTYENALRGTAINLTSAGSGSRTVRKTGEPRYTCNGLIDTGQPPRQILEDMLTSMGGLLIHAGGTWRSIVGAYQTPADFVIEEKHIVGQVTVPTRRGRRDRFNAIKGVYASPLNYNQPTDYPLVTDPGYLAEDNDNQIFGELDLPYTSRSATAQRLARLRLEFHRRQIQVSLKVNLIGWKFRAGSIVKLTIPYLGWTEKTFLVQDWALTPRQIEENGETVGVALDVALSLHEIDAAVYAWNKDTQTGVTIPKVSKTFDPGRVKAPGTPVVSNSTIITTSGEEFGRVDVSWPASTDSHLSGYEVQYKKTADTDWIAYGGRVSATKVQISGLDVNSIYHFRVRAINTRGSRSPWKVSAEHTVTGDSGTPNVATNLSASGETEQATLTWKNSSSSDYWVTRIYRNTSDDSSGATEIDVVSGTPGQNMSYVDVPLAGATTYYWWLKSQDKAGNVSDFTASVSAFVNEGA